MCGKYTDLLLKIDGPKNHIWPYFLLSNQFFLFRNKRKKIFWTISGNSNFWSRVRLPNYELENSKFDFSLFTSLQTSKGICARQMHKINTNKQKLFWDVKSKRWKHVTQNLNLIQEKSQNHGIFVKHQSKLHDFIARLFHVILKN